MTTPLAPGMRWLLPIVRGIKPPETLADVDRIQKLAANDNAITRFLIGSVQRGVRSRDTSCPGPAGNIPLRVYTPDSAASRPRPLVIAIHGGGWIGGGLTFTDWWGSRIAKRVDAVVVAIDYRLGGHHPFPAAVDDCDAAVRWIVANASQFGADPERVAVIGDSAGGNLSAVVCLLARDYDGPAIRHQVLIYPVTDAAQDTASYAARIDDPFLNRASMEANYRFYVPAGVDRLDWRISPLRAKSHANLPPATIIVAELDALRDDGVLYAGALRSAGVEVALHEYAGMPHGFMGTPRFSRAAKPALDAIVTELAASLA